MLQILILVLCGVFNAHGRPAGVGSFPQLRQPSGPSQNIIGGSDAAYNEYPYILSLQYLSATSGYGHFCGGILYKNRYAITTAHCIDNKPVENLRVVAGAIWLEGDVNAQYSLVASYITHPDYEITTGLPNDIAIMTLSTPINTGGTAANAPLPPDDNNLYIQSNCFISGWGQTNPDDVTLSPVLQDLQIPVISNAQCASDLSGLDNAAVFDTHICTLSTNLESGSCDADNGSPLTCCRSETDCSARYVVGLTSYFVTISGGCNVRYPSVHVRTSKFLTWIGQNTP